MSEWITDRPPTFDDAETGYRHYVWVTREDGIVLQMCYEKVGDRPWMPITPPKPYVKPKRWGVREFGKSGQWYVVEVTSLEHAWGFTIPTREAAERIAAIYEEVML